MTPCRYCGTLVSVGAALEGDGSDHDCRPQLLARAEKAEAEREGILRDLRHIHHSLGGRPSHGPHGAGDVSCILDWIATAKEDVGGFKAERAELTADRDRLREALADIARAALAGKERA